MILASIQKNERLEAYRRADFDIESQNVVSVEGSSETVSVRTV